MSLKKQFIKNYLKMQLVSQDYGKLRIKISNLTKVNDKYKGFAKDIKDLIMVLPGIQDITADFDTGIIEIKYSEGVLQPQQVIKWINIVIDVVIDNINLISEKGESDTEAVKTQLLLDLKKRVGEVV